MYSLAIRTNDDTDKFIKIVKPYIEEIPSLLYKIRNCSTKENFIKNSLLNGSADGLKDFIMELVIYLAFIVIGIVLLLCIYHII